MKNIFFILLLMQVFVMLSQDIIITKEKELIKVKIQKYSTDSIIEYTLFNDTLNQIRKINKADIAGVKFEDGSFFHNSDKKININKLIIEETRVPKKGLHIGVSTTGGVSMDNYVQDVYIYDEYGNEIYQYGSSEGFYAQTVIDVKYYLNNAFGLNLGVGYNVNTFSNSFYGNNNDYSRRYFIHNVEIPIRMFVTPGNKFGFYADWGISIKIPVAAYYNTVYTYNYDKRYTETKNIMGNINKFNIIGGGTIGFYGTIIRKLIIYGGATMLINPYSNDSVNLGLKFGMTYRLQPLLSRKK